MNRPELRLLSLSTLAEDTGWLNAVHPPLPWKLETCTSVESALAELVPGDVAVVLCDGDGDPDAWRTMLAECHRLEHPPCLIVTSRLADDRLWAEALNLGAYDVLAKPFDSREVVHAVNRALRYWSMPSPMPFKTALRNYAGAAAA